MIELQQYKNIQNDKELSNGNDHTILDGTV